MEKELKIWNASFSETARKLATEAEIDLFEALRTAFPGETGSPAFRRDSKERTLQRKVLYKGESCGRIIMDSKNRQAWQNAFLKKLRQDQTEASAEHAILATTVFPSGKSLHRVGRHRR